jgi:hypothetical protein
MYIHPVQQVRPDLNEDQCARVEREIDLRYDYTLGLDMAQIRRDVAREIYGPAKGA